MPFDTGEAELKNSVQSCGAEDRAVPAAQLPSAWCASKATPTVPAARQENLKLSRDRAQSVANVLMDLGIDDKRILVEGYGDEYPVDANACGTGACPAEPSGGNCFFRDEKGQRRRRPLLCGVSGKPGLPDSAGFFFVCQSGRIQEKTVQFLSTLHCTVDYCGNCPSTLSKLFRY